MCHKRDATEIPKQSVLQGSGHSKNGCHKAPSIKGSVPHPDTNWEEQRPYRCQEEPGRCWILAVEWARLSSTDKPTNWQRHLHLHNCWHCNLQLLFHLISNISGICRATGSRAALQAGRMERWSFLHYSFNLKGRCFKKTRAFCELLNVATSLVCSPYLLGLKLLLLQPRWSGLQAASQPWGDHTASHALYTCVQTPTDTQHKSRKKATEPYAWSLPQKAGHSRETNLL